MVTFYALIPNVTVLTSIPTLKEFQLKSAIISLNLTAKADSHENTANNNVQLTQQLAVAQAKAKENYFVIALNVPDAKEGHEIIDEQKDIFTVTHELKQLHLSYKKKGFAEVVIMPMAYQIIGQVLADGSIHCPWQDDSKPVVKTPILFNKPPQPIGEQKLPSGFSKIDVGVIATLWLLILNTTALSSIPYFVALLALSQALTIALYAATTVSICLAMLGQMFIEDVTSAKKNLVVGLVNAVGLSLAGGGLIAAGILLPVPGVFLAIFTGALLLPCTLSAVAVYSAKLHQFNRATRAEEKLVHAPVSAAVKSNAYVDYQPINEAKTREECYNKRQGLQHSATLAASPPSEVSL